MLKGGNDLTPAPGRSNLRRNIPALAQRLALVAVGFMLLAGCEQKASLVRTEPAPQLSQQLSARYGPAMATIVTDEGERSIRIQLPFSACDPCTPAEREAKAREIADFARGRTAGDHFAAIKVAFLKEGPVGTSEEVEYGLPGN